MFNPTDLLGGLLQGGGAGMRGNPMGRLEHAMGDRGLGGSGGPLGSILGQLGHTGGGPGRAAHAAGGGGSAMGGDILGGLAGMTGGFPGGGRRPMGREAALGGLGTLAGAILAGRGGMGGGLGGLGGALGGGRGMGGGLGGLGGPNMRGALGAGGLAVLGMLAMRALRNAGQQQQQQPSGGAQGGGGGLGGLLGGILGGGQGAEPAAARDEADQMPPDEAVSDQTAGLVLQAMIEAAKADGRVDATERQRIVAKAEESGAGREAIDYLQQQLNRPIDPDSFASQARDPVVAAQVYAASLLAIQVDTPQEQAYLRDLADRLGLQRAVVAQLHAALGAPAPA